MIFQEIALILEYVIDAKLQDELAKRLSELDQIRHDLKGRLDLRVAIQFE